MKKQILKTIYVVTFMAAFVLFGAVSLFYKNDTIGNEEKVTLGGVGYKDMAGNFDDYFSKSFGFRDKLVNINNSSYTGVYSDIYGRCCNDVSGCAGNKAAPGRQPVICSC